jgi:carboxyl-terminal processing protease
MKILLIFMLAITTSCHHNKKQSISQSDEISQKFSAFLVEHYLNVNHFNKNVDKKLYLKSFLKIIDPQKNILTVKQTKNKDIPVLFKDIKQNLFIIAQITKQNVDNNIYEILDEINNTTVNLEFINKINKVSLDRDGLDFFKNIKDVRSYWKSLYKYNLSSKYLTIVKDNEIKKLDLDVEAKSDYILKKIVYNNNILKESKKDSLKTLNILLNKIKNKSVNEYVTDVINSVVHVYDVHSQYIPPEDIMAFNSGLNGQMEGIGAILKKNKKGLIEVDEVVAGGGAWKSKELENGDIILGVKNLNKEKVSFENTSIYDAIKVIKGVSGSSVTLTIKKNKKNIIKDITIIRSSLEIASSFVKYSIIQKKNDRYGYIDVPKFYRDFENAQGRNCSDDVKSALIFFKKYKLKGVVLDLRNNGGGALIDSQIMSGLFIKKGPIVRVKDSKNTIESYIDSDDKIYYEGNLIVLVNKFSASASEIVAGALQDYNRAFILGSNQTHGKGTVQSVLNFYSKNYPLFAYYKELNKDLGTLKFTTQKFYRITGKTTQYQGVVPDSIVPEIDDYDRTLERNQDFSLKPDTISKDNFQLFMKDDIIHNLKLKSNDRISNNIFFKLMDDMKNINKIKNSRKNMDTSLNEMFKYNLDINNKVSDIKNKLEAFNQDFKVTTNISLFFPNVDKKDYQDKRFKKVSSKKILEFEESLEKDLVLTEAFNIINDMP